MFSLSIFRLDFRVPAAMTSAVSRAPCSVREFRQTFSWKGAPLFIILRKRDAI